MFAAGSVCVDEDSDLLPDEKMEHTGTGRISRMKMRPMSLYESGESNGTVSLNDLFEGNMEDITSMSDLTIDSLAFPFGGGEERPGPLTGLRKTLTG